MSNVVLQTGRLKVEILPPGAYTRARYDWSGMVEQVTLDGRHTFLSRERDAAGGPGLGGIGLCGVFEWEDSGVYDRTAIADSFPLMGVGLLQKTDTAPFLFTRDYPVTPFSRTAAYGPDSFTVSTLPQSCGGVAFSQEKAFAVMQNVLTIRNTIRNVGGSPFSAAEFCHNFLLIDHLPADGGYRLDLCHPAEIRIRRGEALCGPRHYRLGAFDPPTASTAFWVGGWEGLSRHWMRLSHDASPASVLIETEAPVCRFYSWNNAAAFCPETFVRIQLDPGGEISFTRRYTFTAKGDT